MVCWNDVQLFITVDFLLWVTMIFTKQSHHRHLEQVWACRKKLPPRKTNTVTGSAVDMVSFHLKTISILVFQFRQVLQVLSLVVPLCWSRHLSMLGEHGETSFLQSICSHCLQGAFQLLVGYKCKVWFFTQRTCGSSVGQALTHPGTVLDLLPSLCHDSFIPCHFSGLQ